MGGGKTPLYSATVSFWSNISFCSSGKLEICFSNSCSFAISCFLQYFSLKSSVALHKSLLTLSKSVLIAFLSSSLVCYCIVLLINGDTSKTLIIPCVIANIFSFFNFIFINSYKHIVHFMKQKFKSFDICYQLFHFFFFIILPNLISPYANHSAYYPS